jgi:hypothetical protein
MIAHLVGSKPCHYASAEAKTAARRLHGDTDVETDVNDGVMEESSLAGKRRKLYQGH